MPLPFLKFFVSVDEKNGCRTSNNQIALNTRCTAHRCQAAPRKTSPMALTGPPWASDWIGNTYLDDSGRDSPASLNSTGDM